MGHSWYGPLAQRNGTHPNNQRKAANKEGELDNTHMVSELYCLLCDSHLRRVLQHVIYYNLHICFVAMQCNVSVGQNMHGNVILCQMVHQISHITSDTDLHNMGHRFDSRNLDRIVLQSRLKPGSIK